MISAILILLLLPFLNFSSIRSSNFRPFFRYFFWFLVADFLLLGWLGQKVVEQPFVNLGVFSTIFYFIFLVIVPLLAFIEGYLVNSNKDN